LVDERTFENLVFGKLVWHENYDLTRWTQKFVTGAIARGEKLVTEGSLRTGKKQERGLQIQDLGRKKI